jgi:hypothetical protein
VCTARSCPPGLDKLLARSSSRRPAGCRRTASPRAGRLKPPFRCVSRRVEEHDAEAPGGRGGKQKAAGGKPAGVTRLNCANTRDGAEGTDPLAILRRH